MTNSGITSICTAMRLAIMPPPTSALLTISMSASTPALARLCAIAVCSEFATWGFLPMFRYTVRCGLSAPPLFAASCCAVKSAGMTMPPNTLLPSTCFEVMGRTWERAEYAEKGAAMARPRKDQEGEGARDRIERAFWELLEEMPLRSVNVRMLSQRAGVNHNTFYYHFESIDDLALRQIGNNMPSEWFEVAATLASTSFADAELDVRRYSSSPDLQQRFRRFRLLLRSADAQLIEVGKRCALGMLLDALGVDPQTLGTHERLKLTFLIGGVTSLLASSEVESFAEYLDLLQDGLANSIGDLLRQAVNGSSAPAEL